MAGERLAKMISEAKTPDNELTDIIYGEVTSTSPLTIRIDGSGFEITREFIILSQMVRDLTLFYFDTVTSSHSGLVQGATGNAVLSTSNNELRRSIQIFRNLQTGDRVRMIKAHKSQLYYVIERFE